MNCQSDIASFKDQYRDHLKGFLHGVSFRTLEAQYNISVEKAVIDYFKSQGFSPDFILRGYGALKASCVIATLTYPFVPVEIQEVIAIYTTFAILIDDTNNVTNEDLNLCLTRLCRGEPQPNQLLQGTLHLVGTIIPRFYNPLASDMIMKSTLEFISANVIENKYEGKLSLTSTAPNFPYYLRYKSGVAEAYAFFAFPEVLFPEATFLPLYLPCIPDLVMYFNLANDFLSFYKESIVSDERFNYIYNLAHTKGVDPLDALQETMSTLVKGVEDIRTTLSVDPRMRDAIDHIFHGYIMYHASSSRYRLLELDLEEFHAARVQTGDSFDAKAYIGRDPDMVGGWQVWKSLAGALSWFGKGSQLECAVDVGVQKAVVAGLQ